MAELPDSAHAPTQANQVPALPGKVSAECAPPARTVKLSPKISKCPARVRGVTLYRHDAVTEREPSFVPAPRAKQKGEVIGGYSEDSAARLRFLANNSGVRWTCIVLFTYGKVFPCDGRCVQAHWNAFLTALRYHYGTFNYLWVREYQRRGAPHFHMLVDLPVLSLRNRWRRDVRRWVPTDGTRETLAQRLWSQVVRKSHPVPAWGLLLRWEWIRDESGGAKYLSEYASKPEQKTVPDCIIRPGRWWMPSRGVRADPVARIPMDDTRLAACLGGKEKAWNGETYKVLHGAAARIVSHDIGPGIGEAVEYRAPLRLGHAPDCECVPCLRRRGLPTFGCYMPVLGVNESDPVQMCRLAWAEGHERAVACLSEAGPGTVGSRDTRKASLRVQRSG